MRLLLLLALAPALALAQPDSTAAPLASDVAVRSAELTGPPAPEPYPAWGMDLSVGFPQMVELSILWRPLPWLRLGAGPSWDYAGWGVHGGVTWTPIRWAVSPTLGVHAGRFFRLDLNKLPFDVSTEAQPLLERVQLQYVDALLGLEFGSQRGFAFALRFGLTWLEVDSKGTGTFTDSATGDPSATVVTVTDPTFRGSAPTVQLAFQYFF